MEEKEIQEKVKEMVANIMSIDRTPLAKFQPLSKKFIQEFSKNLQSEMTLKESFDFLRLHIKYNIFDLEATRRENQYLKNFIRDDNNA